MQNRIPVAIGAMTSPGLRVAARHADVVAFSGLLQIPGAPPGTFTLASTAQTRERVYEVREQAAGREHRSDALLQVIRLGTDPRTAAEQLAAEWGDITQLTAANLAARGNPLAVFAGSVLALWLIAALAVTLGAKSLDLIPMAWVRRITATILLALCIYTAVTALTS